MKIKVRPVYHLHIPRTAGTNILYEVQRISRHHDSTKEKIKLYTPGVLEFIYDHERMKSYNFISGHFATNPILELKNPFVFTFVREPISQFISSAAYRCLGARSEFTSYELDRYISGEYDVFGEFQGFSGCDNPQSKFLSAKLVEFNIEEENRHGITFVNEPSTFDDVKPFIDNMVCGTVDKRDLVLNRVNKVLMSQFGVEIPNNTNRINSTIAPSFTVSQSQINRMKLKLELDYEIYEYVKAKESKSEKTYI